MVATFELSEAFSAPQLAKRCVLFVLEQFDDFIEMHGAGVLHDVLLRMVPQVGRLVGQLVGWSHTLAVRLVTQSGGVTFCIFVLIGVHADVFMVQHVPQASLHARLWHCMARCSFDGA